MPARYQVDIPENAVLKVCDTLEKESPELTSSEDALSHTFRDEKSLNLGESIDLKSYLIDVEIQLIQKALIQTDGNVSQAAKLLQTNRTTLVEKIKKLKLT